MRFRLWAALAAAFACAPAARAVDFYPIGPSYEWTYLAFEDLGPQGLGFSHKLTRRVLAARPGPEGGVFYWVRESEADPDVGPSASARYAADLLKLPFKPARDVADEIYFADGRQVFYKTRVEPGFATPDEFERQCRLFEADREPFRLRSHPILPYHPEPGMRWEGGAFKYKILKKGPWNSEALRRSWPSVLTVEAQGPERTRTEFYADEAGLVAWSVKSGKDSGYFELAEKRLGPPKAASAPSGELEELRLRTILGPDQEEAAPDDFRLLEEMRRAEKEEAVDFLKAKAGRMRLFTSRDLARLRRLQKSGDPAKAEELSGLLSRLQSSWAVEDEAAAGGLSLILTVKGYELFQKHLSQQAIRDFEELGIQIKYVFYVVDAQERPLFDEEGLLTPWGLDVYYPMRKGQKVVWKLPGQDHPGGPGAVAGEDAAVLALLAKGYEEVSAAELQWLERASGCTQVQLTEQYSLRTLTVRRKRRHFLYKEDELLAFIALYRSGERDLEALKEKGFFAGREGGMCQ